MSVREKLMSIYDEVKQESSVTNELMENIVDYYAKDLDGLIERIHNFLLMLKSGQVDDYTDHDLEIDFALISTEMYRASRELAKLGGESDMAKAKRQEVFNRALQGTGTVQERKARAERVAMSHQIVEDITKRAYDQLKMKLEKADSVYSALKKIYSKRMIHLEIERKDYTYVQRTRENMEECDNE